MKRFYVVEIEEDIDGRGHIVESADVMQAESEQAIIEELQRTLGDHLVTYSIRKATWAERRMCKKNNLYTCIA